MIVLYATKNHQMQENIPHILEFNPHSVFGDFLNGKKN
jgi:hypothetical protein